MLIAEVCDQYHWTLDYCLNMPASAFYVMAKQAKVLRYRSLVDACDIMKIPACDFKYADSLRAIYNKVALGVEDAGEERIAVDQKIATKPKVDDSEWTPKRRELARAGVFEMFAAHKGIRPNGR